jgi:endonuclease/exonuclease/phosphatase (EEP) superfamily protein YafD
MYEDITLMQFNINYSNPNAKAVAGWINNYATINASIDQITQQELPDIVVLQEVSPEIAAQMMLLTQTYPYHFIAPKAGAFGVAIFSRIPIRSSSRKNFTGSWNEYTEIQFHTLATGITILLTELHTIPPVNRDAFTQRNRELREIASIVSQRVAGHSIVIGDMNITPYSRWFRELEQRTGLHNAMQGKNIAGTWPSFLPVPLRIPIDNMLVSDTIEVLERRVEKNLDSDHLPVVTKLRIYATN